MNTGRLGRLGLAMLGAFVAVALLAPVLAPHDPAAFVSAPFSPPGPGHPLGTNDVGQDLLSELIWATRISLLFGFAAGIAGTALGLAAGLAAGTFRGAVDTVLMRLVDVVLVLPFLPLLLILAAFFGAGIRTEILVIAAVIWARPARELRSQALTIRERGHVQAALAMGAGRGYVLRHHVLPGLAPLIPPQFVRAAKGAILLEASLSFLGLGDPTVRSWGTMLYYANVRSAFLTDAWLWWVLPPGLLIGTLVLAFAFAGTALERWGRPPATSRAAGAARRSGRRSGRRAADAPLPGPSVEGPATSVSSGPSPLIEVEDLRVSYGGADHGPVVEAVRGVSLRLERGEVLGIIGESGCGKTTLVHALQGLVRGSGRVTAGHVRLLGHDLLGASAETLRYLRGNRVALVPQSGLNALDPVMRIDRQLTEAMEVHDRIDPARHEQRAAELLERVGLPRGRHAAYPHEFSGGMRQRVLIAMALANQPDLLLADEPTTGLDGPVKVDLLNLLSELSRELGLSVLIVSHDLPAVFYMADRVAVMLDGEIVDRGNPADLVRDAVHPYTRRLLSALAGSPDPHPGAVPQLPAEPHHRQTGDGGRAALVELEDVAVTFAGRRGTVQALDEVDFEIRPGEIVGLVGPSGAGKSTMARLVFQLERARTGQIHFGPAARGKLQLILQDPYSALAPHMPVGTAVAEPLRIQGVSAKAFRAASRSALESVGLTPVERYLDRYPHELSGGERQRVALARALVAEPELIVADEPASMLDAPLRADLLDRLAAARAERGLAVLYITHDIELATRYCDRIVVLDEGRVVEAGPAGRIGSAPEHPVTVRLLDASRALSESIPA